MISLALATFRELLHTLRRFQTTKTGPVTRTLVTILAERVSKPAKFAKHRRLSVGHTFETLECIILMQSGQLKFSRPTFWSIVLPGNSVLVILEVECLKRKDYQLLRDFGIVWQAALAASFQFANFCLQATLQIIHRFPEIIYDIMC